MAEPPSRSAQKDRTRRRLLDESMRLAADHGLAALSLRQVAGGVGVVPTAFYRHVASMDDLGLALVDDARRRLGTAVRDARLAAVESPDPIAAAVSTLGRQIALDRLAFGFLVRERHGGVAPVRRAIADEFDQILAELAGDLGIDVAHHVVAVGWSALTELVDVDRPGIDPRPVLDRVTRELRLIVG
jgi:TetR/AcrR family transcriptional regulator, fatty acid biosynthesis regulator